MPEPDAEAAGLTGRCLCGAVRWRARAPARWMANCHCEDCRRANGAAYASWIGLDAGRFEWVGATPAAFVSSPGVTRRFCPTCGTPLSFESERWPEEIHLLAGTLDDPTRYAPRGHVQWAEHVSWGETADDLPREDRFPA